MIAHHAARRVLADLGRSDFDIRGVVCGKFVGDESGLVGGRDGGGHSGVKGVDDVGGKPTDQPKTARPGTPTRFD